MPLCAAVGCSNRREKGFLMKSFPRNKERRSIWAAQVNRAAWYPSDRSCLCQIHFESSMWLPGTTKLKPTAIPTLFLHQQRTHRSSSKKYYDTSEENLKDEEETLMWISSATVSHADPLALMDNTNVESSDLCETQTEPLVLCKEELEVWTEDCVTGIQRIENYKLLEKYYEDSESLIGQGNDEDYHAPVDEEKIETEMLRSSPRALTEDLSTCGDDAEDKELERPASVEEVYLTGSYCRPLENCASDEENREMFVTGM